MYQSKLKANTPAKPLFLRALSLFGLFYRGSYRAIVENSDRLIGHYFIQEKTLRLQNRAAWPVKMPSVIANVPESLVKSGTILPESTEDFLEFYRGIREGRPCGRSLITKRRGSGGTAYVKERYVIVGGGEWKPRLAIIYLDDVTAERRQMERLKELAEHDGLTGVYNRAAAEEKIRGALDESETGALLIFDIDNLKMINDTAGHAAGDRAIKLAADSLSLHFRGRGVVGRLGGDEFIVFLKGPHDDVMICNLLSLLTAELSSAGMDEYGNLRVTCSAGAAFKRTRLDDFETLYHMADAALRHAKRNGSKRCAVYAVSGELIFC
ncbi:MAG: GGDEF domain-containing protein [Synergistes jonesii]|uniref:GGDEF domain-containing protein n=1 Tax=Synergistes jonesii TaxID=2754 RepID=UPI002A748A8D|nr:GGDEF domain-containing protein [Synergistes jonesii]MDY2985311.1 GGDEF domain-containing protein [Synergistes jonesii]